MGSRMRARQSFFVAAAVFLFSTHAAGAAGDECADLNASGMVSAADALVALQVSVGLDVDAHCPPAGVPLVTGQTTCANTAGTPVACTGTGQDGALRLGVARSFTDNGNGTITDEATGLTWEKLSDDATNHDADFVYTWVQAYSLKIAQLNAQAFGGHTDWRLPNRFELDTLRNMGAANPATWPAFHNGCAGGCTVLTCSCTRSGDFWSSTNDHDPPEYGWQVGFELGYSDGSPKGATAHVRGVRGGR